MAVSQNTTPLPGARQILARMPRLTINAAIDALMDELDRRDAPAEDLEIETEYDECEDGLLQYQFPPAAMFAGPRDAMELDSMDRMALPASDLFGGVA
jgi:hypothetical protein